MIQTFDFYTSYNTFYIGDSKALLKARTENQEDKLLTDRLIANNDLLTARTGSYGHIRGELFILETENKSIDLEKYDHIVEGGLEVTSGKLQISDCPNYIVEMAIGINNGRYKVRIYSSNLASTDIDENDGNDRYRIEVWPDGGQEIKVIKRYKE